MTARRKSSEKSIKAEKEVEEKEDIRRLLSSNSSLLQIASICFKDWGSLGHSSETKPIVRCDHDVDIRKLFRSVIKPKWSLKNPQIVVLVMSNVGPIDEWTNTKQIKRFQKGLMKAAENTNMWLIANGLNVGSTTVIGDAVANYMTEAKYKRSTTPEEIRKKFNFIGITNERMLRYSPTIAGSDQLMIEIPSDSVSTESDKYELNKHFSHYILVKEKNMDKNGINIFLRNFIQFLSTNQITGEVLSEDKEEVASIEGNEVPVVSIIIKGGYSSSRLVLKQIQDQIPVIVLRGSGGLADLLAFVDLEIRDRNLTFWDSEYAEMYLKPELTTRIIGMFPNLRNNLLMCNQFRNRILEIVRQSHKSGQNYLTVINMYDIYSCDLENLAEHMLLALFRSQRTQREMEDNQSETSKGLVIKDLHLCVDWNCPEMAKKEVLAKHPNFSFNSDEVKRIFEDSVLRHNRWKFIDLFLSQKFKLRTVITPKRMVRMFAKIHKNKFFSTICWEGILSREKSKKQGKSFFPQDFNWLVEGITGITNFLGRDELDTYVTQNFIENERSAERKAMSILIFWSLFDFRRNLVRTFWRHSDQPILMALIIAIAYERLSFYVNEETLSNKLKEESQLYVTFACNVLDLVHKDSPYRAEEVLNESTKDFNYKSTVEIASFGKVKTFFSHESVQRWLTRQMIGNIEVIDLRFTFFHYQVTPNVPLMVKLLLSAYLLFPAYCWIRVTNLETDDDKNEVIEEEEDDDIGNYASNITDESPQTSPDQNVSPVKEKPRMLTKGQRRGQFELSMSTLKNLAISKKSKSPSKSVSPLIWWPKAIYEVWSAPITKFWNFQFFYTFYLAVFSVATIFPRCGNYYLDVLISVWTLLIAADNVRQTYKWWNRQSKTSNFFRIFQIFFQLFFVVFHVYNRMITTSSDQYEAYRVKVVMCLALLHAYYVLLTVFLPISATLGPLLYRLKIMIFIDFLNFIRLSILVMVSFGVVIMAVIYPDFPINNEYWRRMYHNTFFTLFVSLLVSELQVNETCTNPANHKIWTEGEVESSGDCSASDFNDFYCKSTGWWPYIFVSSYYVLLKLILITLLHAIFTSSATRLTADTDSIWKFQRYALVMDFVTRTAIPPPLNIFYYLYWTLRVICTLLIDCCCSRDYFKFWGLVKGLWRGPDRRQKLLDDDDYSYLRMLSTEVYDKYEAKVVTETMATQQLERTTALSEDLERHKRNLRQMKGKLCEIERAIRQSYASIESIKHTTDTKHGLEGIGRKNVHTLSRQSPYPYTDVDRHLMPDKYVSWDVMFVDYDPTAYTKPKDEFSPEERPFVDADILLEATQNLDAVSSKTAKLEWNRLTTGVDTIDRRSWDGVNNQTIYKLDNGIPVNPMGRTGLRGRGSLYRWGPNHYLVVVITRSYEVMKRQKMEVLVENIPKKDLSSLISRFIPGEIEQTYRRVERMFKITETTHRDWADSKVMIEYFKSFDKSLKESKTDSKQKTESGVSSTPVAPNLKYDRLIRGYFDDPLNTDNAWKEVELWHFHYTNQSDVLNEAISERLEWKRVNEAFFTSISISHSQVIQMIIDKLKLDVRT